MCRIGSVAKRSGGSHSDRRIIGTRAETLLSEHRTSKKGLLTARLYGSWAGASSPTYRVSRTKAALAENSVPLVNRVGGFSPLSQFVEIATKFFAVPLLDQRPCKGSPEIQLGHLVVFSDNGRHRNCL